MWRFDDSAPRAPPPAPRRPLGHGAPEETGCQKTMTVASVVVYITRVVSSPFERAAHGLLKGTHALDRALMDKAEGQISIVHPCRV